MGKLYKIFENNLKDERVTIPLMKTIEMLLSSDYFSNNELAKDFVSLHTLCVQECSKSKSIVKLIAAAGVFSKMLEIENEELAQKALKTLLFLLF
jgi:tubulin-specific chaperone D